MADESVPAVAASPFQIGGGAGVPVAAPLGVEPGQPLPAAFERANDGNGSCHCTHFGMLGKRAIKME